MGRHRAVGCPAGYSLSRNSGARSAVEQAYPWPKTILWLVLRAVLRATAAQSIPRVPGVHRPRDASAAAYRTGYSINYLMACPTGNCGAVHSSPSRGPPTPGCKRGSVSYGLSHKLSYGLSCGRLRSSPFIAIPWPTDPGMRARQRIVRAIPRAVLRATAEQSIDRQPGVHRPRPP